MGFDISCGETMSTKSVFVASASCDLGKETSDYLDPGLDIIAAIKLGTYILPYSNIFVHIFLV